MICPQTNCSDSIAKMNEPHGVTHSKIRTFRYILPAHFTQLSNRVHIFGVLNMSDANSHLYARDSLEWILHDVDRNHIPAGVWQSLYLVCLPVQDSVLNNRSRALNIDKSFAKSICLAVAQSGCVYLHGAGEGVLSACAYSYVCGKIFVCYFKVIWCDTMVAIANQI